MNRIASTVLASVTLALVSLAAAPAVMAGITVYATPAAFNAAAPGTTLITFDGIAAPGAFVSYGSGGSVSLSGVTFQGNGDVFIIDYGYYGVPAAPGDGFLNSDYAGTDTITTVVLPAGTYAVAANYGSIFGTGGVGESASIDNGVVTNFALPGDPVIGALGFVGFVSTTPINSISFSATPYIVLDNFQFGVADVPEPGAIAFGLLAGGSVLGLIARKRKS